MKTRYYELMVFFYVFTHEFLKKLSDGKPPLLLTNDIAQLLTGPNNTGKFASPVACFLDLFNKAAEGGVLNPHESYRGQFWKLFYQFFGSDCGSGEFRMGEFVNAVRFENDNWWCRVIHQAHAKWWGRLLAYVPGYAAPRVYVSQHFPVVHAYRYIPEMSSVKFYHFHLDGKIEDLNTRGFVRTMPGIPKALQEHLQALRECFNDADTAHGDWISPEYFQAMARQLFLVYTGCYVQCSFVWDNKKQRYRMVGVLPQTLELDAEGKPYIVSNKEA